MPTADVKMLHRLGSRQAPDWLTRDWVRGASLREPMVFTHDEYRRRHQSVVAVMASEGLDALVVFRRSSVRYLTGFHTFAGAARPAVVLPDRILLCVPDDDLALALIGSCADEIMHFSATEDGMEFMALALAARLQSGRVGIDFRGGAIPPAFVAHIGVNGQKVVDADPVVDRCRLVLSPAEQSCLRLAATQTARGLTAAVNAANQLGVTDRQIAAAAVAAMMNDSDSLTRGQVAVATGWRSGITHTMAAGAHVGPDSVTFLEFAGSYADYCAPIIRTLLHGRASGVVRRLDYLAQTALDAVLETLRAGRTAREVAMRCKARVGKVEPEIFFHWNFGYPAGLGHRETWLENHDFHIVEANDGMILPGMAFHIPASFIFVGSAGVGHSHTVLVNEDDVEIITESCGSPELVTVGR